MDWGFGPYLFPEKNHGNRPLDPWIYVGSFFPWHLAGDEVVMEDLDILASRAVVPSYYRAPSPEGMKPHEYQLAGVEYAFVRPHALIADVPGLGKSAEAIMLSNAIRAERTLVVCPASLRLNWEREVHMWSTLPGIIHQTYPILKARDGVSLEHAYVIVSYDMLRNDGIFKALMSGRWDHLVLDEAHYLKDPKGNKRTKAICGWMDGGEYAPGLRDVCGRITMLSGTILPNQPIECYNVIRLLNWDAIERMSLASFRDYFYELGQGYVMGPVYNADKQIWGHKLHWSQKVRNIPRRLDELQYALRKHIMVRRLKDQVLHELPPKQWHMFPLATSPALRQALKHPGWKKAEHLYQLDAGAFNAGVSIDGAISTARRLLGEAKAPAVLEFIKDLLNSGVEKLVVAAWHHSVLNFLWDELFDVLKDAGIVYMDGSTTPRGKQEAVDAFQEDSKVRVILGQTLPLGEGHTLSVAQDVVLVEPDWVPGKNDQLLDRVHRIGQRGGHVIGHVPVVPGSIDERILAVAIEKDRSIHLALDAR